MAYFKAKIMEIRKTWTNRREVEIKSLSLRLAQIKARLNSLTDAYIDRALDKTMFEERKRSLLLDQKSVEENLAKFDHQNRSTPDQLEKFLELAGNAWLSHQLAFPEEKREMVNIFTSNFEVKGKTLALEPSIPFQDIANRSQNDHYDQQRDGPRTLDRILASLIRLNTLGQLPDLSVIAGFGKHDNKAAEQTKT
jgi:hypothetical protein